MKKSSLIIAGAVLAMSAFASMASQATNCGTAARNSHDPFGSCEKSTGEVQCGSDATAVGPVAHIDTTASGGQGVEGCASRSDALPVKGRAGVFVSSSNDVSVFADGDDGANSGGGAGGFDRLDVKHDGHVCFYRGTGGTWWTTGGGHSTADPPTNQCAP